MKLILIICALIAFVYADLDAWNEYKIYLERKYDNNTEIERQHFENFKINHQNIIAHNSQPNITYTLDHNEFSIYSNEDFKKMYLRENNETSQLNETLHVGIEVGVTPDQYPTGPASISFAGYCFPPRHQGTCGTCWAFAASAQVESLLRRKNGAFNYYLSPQYLLDCAPNSGCVAGGNAYSALSYLYYYGLKAEVSYPYVNVKQACRVNAARLTQRISGFIHFNLNGNEQQLANVVAYVGPIAIAMYAMPNFQFMKRGIYYDPSCPRACGSATNHVMLVVGYGVEAGTGVKYWLIKNSWGTSFGENGYVRMFRGYNSCNIACYADFAY